MYTERMAIQDELNFVRREMDNLRDNYNREIDKLRDNRKELLKRLRELDERDFKDQASYDHLNSLTDKMSDVLSKAVDLIPEVSAGDVINHIAESVDKDQIIIPEVNEKESVIQAKPKSETEARIQQAAIEQKNNSVPKQKLSSERVSSVIKEILEDWGSGKVKAIEKEFIKRTGVRFANFYEKMNKAAEAYPNIQKEGFGRWIIKRPESDDKLVS